MALNCVILKKREREIVLRAGEPGQGMRWGGHHILWQTAGVKEGTWGGNEDIWETRPIGEAPTLPLLFVLNILTPFWNALCLEILFQPSLGLPWRIQLAKKLVFFHNLIEENPNKLFGQASTITVSDGVLMDLKTSPTPTPPLPQSHTCRCQRHLVFGLLRRLLLCFGVLGFHVRREDHLRRLELRRLLTVSLILLFRERHSQSKPLGATSGCPKPWVWPRRALTSQTLLFLSREKNGHCKTVGELAWWSSGSESACQCRGWGFDL